MNEATYREIRFSDDDIVNLDDWRSEYCTKAWLFHDHGFCLAVVFADNLQDALDAAVDADKLDRFLVDDTEMADYPDDEGLTFLGNASEPFDIESLGYVELPSVELSFCQLFNAQYDS